MRFKKYLYRSSRYPNLINESYFKLVFVHNLVLLRYEFGQVLCAIEVSTSEAIALFRREIYDRVGA